MNTAGLKESFSLSVVRYCLRKSTSVLLGNAVSSGVFTGDEYIRKHNIKSLICIPGMNNNECYSLLMN